MTKAQKDLILRALDCYRGDDHIRAERAFARMTPAQMSEQWGQSGKTCRQILDEYRANAAAVDRAFEAVRRVTVDD